MLTAIGTASSNAMNDVTTVPNASAAIPNFGGLSLVNQFLNVRKFAWLAFNAGIALVIRNAPIATMMTRTRRPAPLVRPRKPISKLQRFLWGRAPPPPSGGAGTPGSPPGGPPAASPVSMSVGSVGSPAVRGCSVEVVATSAKLGNAGSLIRVSSPFTVDLRQSGGCSECGKRIATGSQGVLVAIR